jgi:hypothetical protein
MPLTEVCDLRTVVSENARLDCGLPKRAAFFSEQVPVGPGWVPVARSFLGRPVENLNFKAFLHQRVCNVPLPLPTVKHPILPWALFSFKVPYGSLTASVEKSFS